MASLESFERDGYTYFHLCISCPVCIDRGNMVPQAYWSHHNNNCNGDIYLGENNISNNKENNNKSTNRSSLYRSSNYLSLREIINNEFADKQDEMITGIVSMEDQRNYYIDLRRNKKNTNQNRNQ